jgi:hypothetical protein
MCRGRTRRRMEVTVCSIDPETLVRCEALVPASIARSTASSNAVSLNGLKRQGKPRRP